MIQWNEEVTWIAAKILNAQEELEVKVMLTPGIVQGGPAPKTKWLLDGVSKRKKDVVAKLTAIRFSPDDMDMLSGSPSLRRTYLNEVLVQSDLEYRVSLDSYEKALARRNALLDLLREGRTTRASFAFWDALLIKHGEVLFTKRRAFCEWLDVQGKERGYKLTYQAKPVTKNLLDEYAQREVAAGHTLIGPHKDDVLLQMSPLQQQQSTAHELGRFGSRGQQRMAVFWLKKQASEWMMYQTGARPLLLLDDVFSELDEGHRKEVLDQLDGSQVILTSIEPVILQRKHLEIAL